MPTQPPESPRRRGRDRTQSEILAATEPPYADVVIVHIH